MMDEFMKSLSDEQKALFLAALQSSMQPKNDIEGTTTMPPHIKEEFDTPKPEPKVQNDFAMNQRKRSGTVQSAGYNLFTDEGSCKGKEYATPEYTPSPRTRKPSKKIEVRCHACGKPFLKLESMVTSDYHRCDRCCGG